MATSNRVDSTNILGNIQKIFSTLENKIEKDVREHLKNVYSTLAIALVTTAVGAAVNIVLGLQSLSFLFAIAQFALLFVLMSTPHSQANEHKRLAYLLGFAFLIGCNTGPLIEFVGFEDPTIVFNAYLITMIVFGAFTMSALYADNTKFLHLGGILGSGLLVLLITSIFARSAFMYSIVLWGGLALHSAFILYDTQLIMERRRRGDNDYIWHTVDFLIDFVNVFRHILIILKEKNESGNRRRNN